MSRPFYFRHFVLKQDKAAMKVGTDSMLLGALVPAENASAILDIGTGTGILALMLAQRSKAQIDAIEIDEDAYSEAKENFNNSMWCHRISAHHTSLQEFSKTATTKYDLIVSNPPYFPAHESLKSSPGEHARKKARQTQELTLDELAVDAAGLLKPHGSFYLILPAEIDKQFEKEAGKQGLFLQKKILVRSKPGGEVVRVISAYGLEEVRAEESEFIIYNENGKYSTEYVHATKAYHALDME
jgi:tRNA1Val (adenine37-N6)-methyltransferase